MSFLRKFNHANLYKRDRVNFQAMNIGKLTKKVSFSVYCQSYDFFRHKNILRKTIE